MKTNQIPEGYMENNQGHLVPIESIDELDILRNDVVTQIIMSVQEKRQELKEFKEATIDEISLFLSTSAEKYEVKFGGKKGNLTLMSFDGKFKVMIAVSDSIEFDERLHISKQLVDECIHNWTENSSSNIKALIEHAFQADKKGNINTARVLGLLRLKIDDKKWKEAMVILKDSISISSSKSYMRFYERTGPEDKFQQISLDVSSL